MKITETQKFQLLKAIDDAKEFENCRYSTASGQPVCVIGQLYSLVAPDLNLLPLEGLIHEADSVHTDGVLRNAGFDLIFLRELQEVWDSGTHKGKYLNEDEAREVMRHLVEECEVIDG